MEKMRFESVDGFQENIRRLADIFPSCVKEQKDNDGKTIRKVDINTLQLLLGINQKESETCEFSWVGKREAAPAPSPAIAYSHCLVATKSITR